MNSKENESRGIREECTTNLRGKSLAIKGNLEVAIDRVGRKNCFFLRWEIQQGVYKLRGVIQGQEN